MALPRTQKPHPLTSLLIVVVAATLAACSLLSRPVAQKDLIGTWSASDGATIQLKDDGTFAANGLMDDVIDYKFPSERTSPGPWHSGSGTWMLDRGKVYLQFTEPADLVSWAPFEVEVDGSGDSVSMHFVIGDPDDVNWYQFRRS